MILSNRMKPKNTIYYLGAKLIESIKEQPTGIIDSLLLFNAFKKNLTTNVTFVQYMYTLNWLYLIDLINLNDEGDIIVCF